jgi:hypothetical protein
LAVQPGFQAVGWSFGLPLALSQHQQRVQGLSSAFQRWHQRQRRLQQILQRLLVLCSCLTAPAAICGVSFVRQRDILVSAFVSLAIQQFISAMSSFSGVYFSVCLAQFLRPPHSATASAVFSHSSDSFAPASFSRAEQRPA